MDKKKGERFGDIKIGRGKKMSKEALEKRKIYDFHYNNYQFYHELDMHGVMGKKITINVT